MDKTKFKIFLDDILVREKRYYTEGYAIRAARGLAKPGARIRVEDLGSWRHEEITQCPPDTQQTLRTE